jgi:hypothetical protein
MSEIKISEKITAGKNTFFRFGSLYFVFVKIDVNTGPVLTSLDENWGCSSSAGTAFHCGEICQVPHFTLCYNYIFNFLNIYDFSLLIFFLFRTK